MPLAADGFATGGHRRERGTDRSPCATKSRYPSRAKAAQGVRWRDRAHRSGLFNDSRRSYQGELEPYYCPLHGCWHVGHSRPASQG